MSRSLWLCKVGLKGGNFFLKAHDVTEFVHAIQQAGFIERVDREGKGTVQGRDTVWVARSTVSSARGASSTRSKSI